MIILMYRWEKYMIHVVDANACITYLQMLIDSPYRWIYLYIYICIHVYIHTLHDMISLSHSYTLQGKHQQIHFPTQPKPRNNENHVKLQPLIQTPMFSIATLWPFNETAPLAGAATAWCVPFVTCVTVGRRSGDRRWRTPGKPHSVAVTHAMDDPERRQRHMTRAAG